MVRLSTIDLKYVIMYIEMSLVLLNNKRDNCVMMIQRSKEQMHSRFMKEDKYPRSVEESENLPILCLVTP